MGMYDYLHSISRNIEQNQVDIKKSQEHQKQIEFVQSELDGLLMSQLKESDNIYSDDTKDMIIDTIINSTDLRLYSIDYTRQYLLKRYYTIARQVEQIKKKQGVNDDYKKQIALEKWDLQKQIMQQKISEKSQKEAEQERIDQARRQQARRQLINDLLQIGGKIFVFTCKATLYMILAPLFIIACFGGGFLGGMIKLK